MFRWGGSPEFELCLKGMRFSSSEVAEARARLASGNGTLADRLGTVGYEARQEGDGQAVLQVMEVHPTADIGSFWGVPAQAAAAAIDKWEAAMLMTGAPIVCANAAYSIGAHDPQRALELHRRGDEATRAKDVEWWYRKADFFERMTDAEASTKVELAPVMADEAVDALLHAFHEEDVLARRLEIISGARQLARLGARTAMHRLLREADSELTREQRAVVGHEVNDHVSAVVQGLACLASGRLDLAIRFLLEAGKYPPRGPERCQLARELLAAGEVEAVREYLQRVAVRRPALNHAVRSLTDAIRRGASVDWELLAAE